ESGAERTRGGGSSAGRHRLHAPGFPATMSSPVTTGRCGLGRWPGRPERTFVDLSMRSWLGGAFLCLLFGAHPAATAPPATTRPAPPWHQGVTHAPARP